MPAINRVQEHVQDVEPTSVWPTSDSCSKAITEYPMGSVLTAFGIGLGVGAVVGSLLSDPEPDPHSSAAAIGRRVLDSLSDYLPASMRS
ncbi:MAG: hypothetical protein R3B90_12690 [Planctomycetaceae bacterium]